MIVLLLDDETFSKIEANKKIGACDGKVCWLSVIQAVKIVRFAAAILYEQLVVLAESARLQN